MTFTLSRRWLAHVFQGLLATALVVAWWSSWQHLQLLRQEISENQRRLAQAPHELLREQSVSAELKKHENELDHLQALLPRREAIGEVVARLESEAKLNGVTVVVPDVKEEVRYGKDNKPIPQTGRYLDVRLTIQGLGEPVRLLQFLHTVEHLPYVLKIPDWKITTHYLVLPAALTVSAPPTSDSPAPSHPAGLLEAGVVLTITRES